MFGVIVLPSAEKQLSKLPRDVQERIAKLIDRIETSDGFPPPAVDATRLRGVEDGWRVRVGSYRGLCKVEATTVTFTKFGHRSTIY